MNENANVDFRRVFMLAALLLTGCSSGPRALTATNGVTTRVAELPSPLSSDYITAGRAYLVGPFDRLTVNVFGVEEMKDIESQVDGAGRISFPLIGAIDAAGKTPSELEALIARRLQAGFIRNPQVSVNLKETVSQVVTVDGQVTQPGLYPVVGNMTLLRAIALAKGAKEFARLDDVVLFRTVQGQKLGALYNLKTIRQGGYPDPQVFPNDVIIVGEDGARRAMKDAISAIPGLLGTLLLRF